MIAEGLKVAVSTDAMLERIETLVRRRTESDRRMSYAWMIVPILPLAAAIAILSSFVGIIVSILPRVSNLTQTTAQNAFTPVVAGLLALYGLAVTVYFGVLFLGALSFYFMIERRNRHFVRQQLLYSALYQYLASKKTDSASVANLGYLTEDSAAQDNPKPAGIWALLFMFVSPIIGLILSYTLTRDLRKHEAAQSKFQTELAASLGEAGFVQPDFSSYRPRGSDPILFLILSAITGGLFWIYWY